MRESYLIYALGLLAILVIFYFTFILFKKKKTGHLKRSLDMSLFLIRLPKYESSNENRPDIKAVISKMEQFYSNFMNIDKGEGFLKKFFLGSPRVVFEISSELGGDDVSFYIAVPLKYEKSINKYVQGVYPGAVVEKKSEDYTIFEPNGVTSASFLKLTQTHYLPLNTYQEIEGDPLESITNSITNINPDEGAAIQILIRPSQLKVKSRGEKIISQMKNNSKTLSQAINEVNSGGLLKDLMSALNSGEDNLLKESNVMKVDESVVEAVRNKIKKTSFDVNIRLIGVAKERDRSEEILHNLESSFSQLSSANNRLSPIRIKGKRGLRRFIYDFSFRNFNGKESNLLNVQEISSIYHFPLSHMESPYIKWVRTKDSPPPSNLPKTGSLFIGEAVYRGEEKSVFIASRTDRRRHFYVIGQTGTGKTTLLREMIRQDIEKGEGVGAIDPHGDLIEDTLANIPKERINDVVLFEPSNIEQPCGLNMLEWNTPEQRDLAVSEMIMIFTSLFPPEMIGPYFEHYMRNAMLALMSDKNDHGTLVEIPRMFTDDRFMEMKLKKVDDILVRNFWLKEWKNTSGQTRSDMLGYVISKIGRFIENEMMRNIIGQNKSSFNFGDIMDEKKIFLVNLSKGLTGEINSSLLGLILVSKLQIAALARARMPEEERKDFYLYIDEFQNFTTDSIATILSEARKYRLCLTLAHQYMPQLKEEIKNAVIGNVGAIASYRIGATDAEFLENQFSPEFSKFDLSNLDNYQYLVKMLIDSKITSPFKINAPIPQHGDRDKVEKIRAISRVKYGRPRALVEDEIAEKLNLDL